MDLAETERFLASIETVECCFPDTWGIFVGRRMPAAGLPGCRGTWHEHAERSVRVEHRRRPRPHALRERRYGVPQHARGARPLNAPAGTVGRTHRLLPDGCVPRAGRGGERARFAGDPPSLGRDARRPRLRGVGGPRARVLPVHARLATGLRRSSLLVDDPRGGARTGHRRDPIDAPGRGSPDRVEPDRGRSRTVRDQRVAGVADRGGRQRRAPEVRGEAGRATPRAARHVHAHAVPRR